ncbi:MAG: hypothetical protein ACYCWW_02345 [Deltaproteobacteria bacterium]
MPAPSGNRLALALLAATALLGLLAFFFFREPPPAPAPPPAIPRLPAARIERPAVFLPAAAARLPSLPTPQDGGGGLSPYSLISPESAVSTQVRLLEEGRDQEFKATFMPDVQDQLTPDAIEACRKRLAQVRVQPDWEMAEDGAADGHKVERVSMFGKSMTGFHDMNGQWLADAVWCLPVGLP